MFTLYNSKKKSNLILLVILFICVLLLSVKIIRYEPYIFDYYTYSKLSNEETELPVTLRIPDINVNAKIEYVSLTQEGAMGTARQPLNVAWLSTGTRPGDVGSAVINGHYGWRKGKPEIFNNLNDIDIGDHVYIDDAKGNSISFIVREKRLYNSTDNASEVFYSENGAHLNLITCEGEWNTTTENYPNRLVIFTDLVI